MSKMETRLSGICPILPTPFDENNHVDVESLRQVVRFLLESGVTGIALFGNASEAFALTQEEKDFIAKVVAEENAGRVPLIFGAGGTSTETAISSCHWAEASGADVLMIMPPYMIKPDATRVYEYYAGIAKNVSTPIMIQDAPGACGVNISVQLDIELPIGSHSRLKLLVGGYGFPRLRCARRHAHGGHEGEQHHQRQQ